MSVKITFLGGLGEIGMNCFALETERTLFVVDCGLQFLELDHYGIDYGIPPFAYIHERKDKFKGFVITHGHEDHIGALPFAIREGLKAPIYASPFASKLVEDRLLNAGFTSELIRTFEFRKQFEVGDFKITPLPVNHSIVESVALAIDSPVGKIIHTGDFKIDPSPFYGNALDLDEFRKLGDEGVHLLLSDSTNVESIRESLSEANVQTQLEKVFGKAEGLVLVSMFASNVGRIGQVLQLANKLDKKVALAGRSLDVNSKLAQDVGYLKDAKDVLISIEDLDRHERSDVIVIATGSQGEFRSALARIAAQEHKYLELEKGDLVVFSSKFIPGNEVAISRLINQLFRLGADVLYEAIHEVHVSGHATRPELKRMLEAVRPKFFIPVHGEFRHLVHHARLAVETGVAEANVRVVSNGQTIAIEPEELKVHEEFEFERTLIEHESSDIMDRVMLRDRRKLGQKGAIFIMMTRNAETGAPIAGPEIVLRGIVREEEEDSLIGQLEAFVRRIIRESNRKDGSIPAADELEERVRIEVRRFVRDRYGSKPNAVPVIVDL